MSSVSTAKWTIIDVPEAGDQQATYTFRCVNAVDFQIGYDLVFGLAGTLNQAIGSLQLSIAEHSGPDPKNMSWSTPAKLALEKVWPRFYLQNLVSAIAAAPTDPVTEFAAGAPMRLSWESNGTWFEVYEKARPTPVYAGTATYCDVPGVSTDTTFFVVASVSGNPPGDENGPGFEPILLYDSIGVTISNPVLTPTSVSASGGLAGASLAVSGAASAKDVQATGAITAESVAASSGISGASVTASGAVSGASLAVTGAATAASIAASGQISAASVAATGQVSAGSVSTTGAVSASTVYAKGMQTSVGDSIALMAQNNSPVPPDPGFSPAPMSSTTAPRSRCSPASLCTGGFGRESLT